MRILIIRNIPSRMEVRKNTYNIQEVGLARALVRRGEVCDILFWTDEEEETVVLQTELSDYVGSGGEIRVFYRHGKSFLKNAIFTECEDLFEKYDILQPCEYNQVQSWILAKKYPGKTIIYHGPYYSAFNKRYNLMCMGFDLLFLRQYIRMETHFLAKSELAHEFLARKGIAAEYVDVVSVGIDVKMLETDDQLEEPPFVHKMREDESRLKLLYIGRFEERRNIPFLLDVFREVLRQCPSARLYMIGTGEEAYVQMVSRKIEQDGLSEFVARQEKMEQKYLAGVYREANVFLLPTKYEIFGMVLLEAMYYGNVVLTTDNGGSRTLIKDGENGFILEADIADSWAERILELKKDPEKCRRMGKCAQRTVAESFTWDALAERFIGNYEKVQKPGSE